MDAAHPRAPASRTARTGALCPEPAAKARGGPNGAPRANLGALVALGGGVREARDAAGEVSWDLAEGPGGRGGPDPGTLRAAPAVVAGRCESAKPSQTAALNLLGSHCERFSGTVRISESVPAAHPESVRTGLGLRSPFSLIANQRRGSVNRSPQGAIRGGFAVSPQNSGRFARCTCSGAALARARRERRASSMSAAWDSSPALSPVPWGERSREAFNCVPGDQQSAPMINSFGVRDRGEPVDHRGAARDERRTVRLRRRHERSARVASDTRDVREARHQAT